MSIATVPVPRRMRALACDHRGCPVPFVIQRDRAGMPVFAANDARRTLRCIVERRCSICGNRLRKILWFAGGPLAAFHPQGAYLDPAMHYECMAYALRVCPYLALRQWAHGDGVVNAAAQRLIDSGAQGIAIDPTMIAQRPPVFVAVATGDYTWWQDGITFPIRPAQPYLAVEFWRHGARMEEPEGLAIAKAHCEAFKS